jgi:hypothetical protein
MSDIFKEVDEEVQRDKAVEFWTKYQNAILAVAILIVIATGGYRFWQYRQAQAAEAAGSAFQDALKLDAAGKPDEARAALEALQKAGARGYDALGRFVDAGLTTKKDPKAGAAAYDALANDASLDSLLRDTAKLRGALARLEAGETDAAKATLEQLANGPYRNTARLTLASLALAAKDYAGGGKWLDQVLGDAEASQSERHTADILLGLVAAQGSKPKS